MSRLYGDMTSALHSVGLKPRLQGIQHFPKWKLFHFGTPCESYIKENPIVRKFRIVQPYTISGSKQNAITGDRTLVLHSVGLKHRLRNIAKTDAVCKKCTLQYVVGSILGYLMSSYDAYQKAAIAKNTTTQSKGGKILALHSAGLKPHLRKIYQMCWWRE